MGDPPRTADDEMTPIRRLLSGDQPVTWVFAGDSVTAGLRHTVGLRDYTELFTERVRVEMSRSRDAVIKTAVGGWSARTVLANLDQVALRFQPDVVVLGVGLNDRRDGPDGISEFRETYRDLIGQLRAAGVAAVMQTPNACLPTAARPIDHLPLYVETIRALASEIGAPLVDHYAVWHDAGIDRFHSWIGHGCHPNGYGHRVMARTLLQAFDIYAEDSLTCRLTVP
jgi:lysophospholipase L1-like esterase